MPLMYMERKVFPIPPTLPVKKHLHQMESDGHSKLIFTCLVVINFRRVSCTMMSLGTYDTNTKSNGFGSVEPTCRIIRAMQRHSVHPILMFIHRAEGRAAPAGQTTAKNSGSMEAPPREAFMARKVTYGNLILLHLSGTG